MDREAALEERRLAPPMEKPVPAAHPADGGQRGPSGWETGRCGKYESGRCQSTHGQRTSQDAWTTARLCASFMANRGVRPCQSYGRIVEFRCPVVAKLTILDLISPRFRQSRRKSCDSAPLTPACAALNIPW